MPLNSSGPISIGGSTTGQSINLELGLSATAQSSLNDNALRTLAGVASGAISLSNFYGKSNVSFTPDGGPSSGSPVYLIQDVVGVAQITITCTQSAVWNWVRVTGSVGNANVATGGSATSITFTLTPPVQSGTSRSAAFTLNGTAGGITRYWYITLVATRDTV